MVPLYLGPYYALLGTQAAITIGGAIGTGTGVSASKLNSWLLRLEMPLAADLSKDNHR